MALRFLAGGGEMGERIRTFDWGATPLGDPRRWPAPLKTIVGVMLAANQPMFATWGPERIVLYNDGYARILGAKHPAALGRRFDEVWHEILDQVGPLIGRCYDGQGTSMDNLQLTMLRHGYPEETHFSFFYAPLRGEDGTVGGVFCACQEITGQVMAERARLSELDRLRQLFERSPSFMAVLSGPNHRFDFANRSYLDLIGRADVAGLPLAEVLPGITEQGFLQILDRVRATGEPYVARAASVLLERAPGEPAEERILDFVFQPIADGTVDGIFVEGVDVTEARRAEAGLRELNAELERRMAERTGQLDRLWRTSQDLLAVIGPDGVLRAANPAWAGVLGLDPARLVGRTMEALVLPEEREATREALRRAAAGALPGFENRLRHADGRARWIAWAAAPDESGLIYATGRDITAEREAKRALAAAEEALRQSQKMEALGQLTGGIAHDFNNLLTGIIGSIDIMRRRIEAGRSSEVGRYMDAASGAAARAASLTHRLLAFARRQSLDTRQLDANALVAGMEELLRRTLGEQIGLRIRLDPDPWPALTDTNQLENAILNLAINARDAMPDGGLLTIETGREVQAVPDPGEEGMAAGDYVTIRVADTGLGMPPDVLARAFEPFFTTKPIGQGTGLGLSMIYGFAKQSRGHVRVESTPGQGTAFTLLLPRAGEMVAEREAAAPAAAPRGRGETVLLVEDDPTVRLLVTEVLDELGYRYLEAAHAGAAIPVLQSDERIDLMISDVGLPGLNGRQLAEIARAARPGLRVLFITGYAETATLRSGFLGTGMDMMTKPFALDALGTRIRSMLEVG
ncbi:PAS domain-containing protein [Roseomonas sp. GCM10028921]